MSAHWCFTAWNDPMGRAELLPDLRVGDGGVEHGAGEPGAVDGDGNRGPVVGAGRARRRVAGEGEEAPESTAGTTTSTVANRRVASSTGVDVTVTPVAVGSSTRPGPGARRLRRPGRAGAWPRRHRPRTSPAAPARQHRRWGPWHRPRVGAIGRRRRHAARRSGVEIGAGADRSAHRHGGLVAGSESEPERPRRRCARHRLAGQHEDEAGVAGGGGGEGRRARGPARPVERADAQRHRAEVGGVRRGRPSSSSTTATSAKVAPAPPSASGTSSPVHPAATTCPNRGAARPGTGRSRATARSSPWNSGEPAPPPHRSLATDRDADPRPHGHWRKYPRIRELFLQKSSSSGRDRGRRPPCVAGRVEVTEDVRHDPSSRPFAEPRSSEVTTGLWRRRPRRTAGRRRQGRARSRRRLRGG